MEDGRMMCLMMCQSCLEPYAAAFFMSLILFGSIRFDAFGDAFIISISVHYLKQCQS